MPATRNSANATEPPTEATPTPAVTKAAQPPSAERKAGVLARRKVRTTAHVIERIDGRGTRSAMKAIAGSSACSTATRFSGSTRTPR